MHGTICSAVQHAHDNHEDDDYSLDDFAEESDCGKSYSDMDEECEGAHTDQYVVLSILCCQPNILFRFFPVLSIFPANAQREQIHGLLIMYARYIFLKILKFLQ